MSLSRREKIFTAALGIAYMATKHDVNAVANGVHQLSQLWHDDFKKELKENADKWDEEEGSMSVVMAHNFDATHHMSREDRLFVIMCGIASATQQHNSEVAVNGALKLARMITDAEIEKAQAMVYEQVSKCPCPHCRKALEHIEKYKSRTGESFSA